MSQSTIRKHLDKLEQKLEPFLGSGAPLKIPETGKKILPSVVAWLTLFGVILVLPWLFLAITVGTSIGFIGSVTGVTLKPFYYVSILILVGEVALVAMALPGLFNRTRRGWRLMFYAILMNLVYALFNWFSSPAAVVALLGNLIINGAILYLLFQIRPKYR